MKSPSTTSMFRDEHEAVHTHHNALHLILKSEFATGATNKTARVVELKAAELSTKAALLSPSGKPMGLWEESGNVKLNPGGTFDANLFHLVVKYLGQTIIDMLWGKVLIKTSLLCNPTCRNSTKAYTPFYAL